MWSAGETRVFTAADLDLRVTDGNWPFAARHAAEIDAHWERRVREMPGFFNGLVHVLTDYALSGGTLRGCLIRVPFKGFLYWRETGHPDRNVMDAFGSGLILSAEGEVLLGRQRAGNLNSGLSYPPGGFIDARDVGPDGRVDLEGSVAREISEETGLAAPAIRRAGGYVITVCGPALSIAVPYRATLPAATLLGAARRHIANDPDHELADVVLATPGQRCASLSMPAFAEALLDHLAGLEILA